MKRTYKERHPIFKKIFVPIFCLMIFQSAIFYFAAVYGGVIDALNKNASDILAERVINRETELETRFTTRWTNLADCANALNKLYQTVQDTSDTPIYRSLDLQKQVLSQASPELISMLRANSVNGVFLILNNGKEYQPLKDDEAQEKYGLCIRDYDPESSYTDKEDLLVVRCPTSLISDVGCPLETWWEALYTFDSTEDSDYYYKPLETAYENPGVSSDNLAYLSGVHHFADTDKAVVSYSMPLVDSDGYPYAVLGVEFTTTYLESLLPSEELQGANKGAYALVQYDEGSEEMQVLAHDGTLYQRGFGSEDTFKISDYQKNGFVELNGKNGLQICGSLMNITIYNRNTPFESRKLALFGMVERKDLYSFGVYVKKLLLLVAGLILVIGSVGIFVVSRRLTAPIKKLASKVRGMDVQSEVNLERIKIDEIDELVNALEEMSRNINRTQVRTEFFSRMSHDMRTPMNAIIGFSSPEILENATEEKKDEYLGKIQASGTYLLGLINEVLDMTKIDSQKMEINEEPVAVEGLWEDTIPIITELSKQKGVDFRVKVGQEEGYLYADRQRISQVLVNLLSNAVKFTPEGGTVSFTVSVLECTTDRVRHEIVIKDTGIGMSEEFQKNLYQPFTQEKAGLVEGTGLGLSITKRLIELMGGSIQCVSNVNQGTEFTVILDNRIAPEPVGMEQKSNRVQSDSTQLNGKRILVCEDHPLNMQITSKLLERVGILTEPAQNGRVGVEKFRKSPRGYYDAILMDIRMPELNGIEATKAIRGLPRTDAQTIPIIAMTANAFAEDIRETSAAGMNEHLSKPIEPDKLYRTLEEYLGQENIK